MLILYLLHIMEQVLFLLHIMEQNHPFPQVGEPYAPPPPRRGGSPGSARGMSRRTMLRSLSADMDLLYHLVNRLFRAFSDRIMRVEMLDSETRLRRLEMDVLELVRSDRERSEWIANANSHFTGLDALTTALETQLVDNHLDLLNFFDQRLVEAELADMQQAQRPPLAEPDHIQPAGEELSTLTSRRRVRGKQSPQDTEQAELELARPVLC